MPISGMPADMTGAQLQAEVDKGAKIVVFEYCISILVMTFRRSSDPFYLAPGQSGLGAGLPYSLLSLLLGWWGIPWGFIYTPMVLFTNLSGGRDVTHQVINQLVYGIQDEPG